MSNVELYTGWYCPALVCYSGRYSLPRGRTTPSTASRPAHLTTIQAVSPDTNGRGRSECGRLFFMWNSPMELLNRGNQEGGSKGTRRTIVLPVPCPKWAVSPSLRFSVVPAWRHSPTPMDESALCSILTNLQCSASLLNHKSILRSPGDCPSSLGLINAQPRRQLSLL